MQRPIGKVNTQILMSSITVPATSLSAAAIWANATRTLSYPINPTIGQSSGVADISLTPGNGAKSAWVQLLAATNARSIALIFSFQTPSNLRHAIDIGVGPAAGEVVVIPNLRYENESVVGQDWVDYTIPIDIASGSRIAVRAQANGAAGAGACHLIVLS